LVLDLDCYAPPEGGRMIVCAVTGRIWPPVKAFELRDCVRCGGKIDIRHQAWLDGKEGAEHDHCPEVAR
jgi:hypothetical protein